MGVPVNTPWGMKNGMHYKNIKAANRYDLWRRELKCESFAELFELMEPAAKMLNMSLKDYIEQQFELWDKGLKNE